MTAGQAERLVRENERLRLEVAELRRREAGQQRRLLGDPDGAF
jgi:regulator of replication initiation timing